ncbi:hypothetical protein EUGRSUZ_D02038 [Eucalyptus grandis]|uniref:Uncharacterized protein n=2 Tax=Eucalyptus grandis TaxID=71139 RepID=A0ACC3LQR1_EUCGR|nr:hypothetical protein EUGRSUZ_D02038 [Eucalyptus grandis]
MAQSKNTSPSFALFLSINLLFFALASGCNSCEVLKLGVCATFLNGPVNAVIRSPPDTPCCSALEGLLDLKPAFEANVLVINLNIHISLSLLINT